MLSILLKLILILLSTLVFLFLVWQRLKEDYTRNQIFTLAISSLLALYVGGGIGLLASKLTPSPIFNPTGLWFWFGLLLSAATTLLLIFKFHMRIYEVVEGYVLGLISLGFLWSIIFFLPGIIVFLLLYVVFFIIDLKYKEFSWYKSGKMGLAGLTCLALFFILRAVVAIVNPNMVSFIGRVDALVSAVVAFTLFLSVYNLSEKV